MPDMLLTNVRPMGGESVDVLIVEGHIARIGAGLDAPDGVAVEDGAGTLLLPGLVEAHVHLDKNVLGLPWRSNSAGPTIRQTIDNERTLRTDLGMDPARQSARLAALCVANGSTHIRSHIDIDTTHGLAGVEGVLATKEAFRDEVEIQTVAFPQSGLLTRPGTLELMAAALEMGVDVVGGIDPCTIEFDPKGHVDAVFGLAEKFGRPVDIHLHEPNELGLFSMTLIAERTRALGMAGKVAISHAFALGMADGAAVEAMLEVLAASGVAIMTTGPAGHPAPPVKRLRAAGVDVCAGSDNIRDLWSPYGNGDMLDRARLVGMRNWLATDDDLRLAFDLCSFAGAKMLGLSDFGLAPGDVADAVLVEAGSVAEAVVVAPPRKLVLKRGRVVARDGRTLRPAA